MKELSIIIILAGILFSSCQQKRTTNETAETVSVDKYAEYEELAYEIILKAKGILGMNLITSIQQGGASHAVSFCSEKAIFLTDSVAAANEVSIKRVAEKYRNPLNAAGKNDLAYIRLVEESIKNGEKAKPQLLEKGDKLEIRYPIFTDELCLQCHGKINENISVENLSRILSVYPEDKATGFEIKSLRGIWVVEMNK